MCRQLNLRQRVAATSIVYWKRFYHSYGNQNIFPHILNRAVYHLHCFCRRIQKQLCGFRTSTNICHMHFLGIKNRRIYGSPRLDRQRMQSPSYVSRWSKTFEYTHKVHSCKINGIYNVSDHFHAFLLPGDMSAFSYAAQDLVQTEYYVLQALESHLIIYHPYRSLPMYVTSPKYVTTNLSFDPTLSSTSLVSLVMQIC